MNRKFLPFDAGALVRGITKSFRGFTQSEGLPPGTLVHVGDKPVESVKVMVFSYDREKVEETACETPADALAWLEKPGVVWINIVGVHDIQVIEDLGKATGLHPLLMEDIVHTRQRPKVETYDGHIFMVLRMPSFNEAGDLSGSQQVSLVLGKNYVISFEEVRIGAFENVRARIRADRGLVRRMGADYLAYLLADGVVDAFFRSLDRLSDEVDALYDVVEGAYDAGVNQRLHRLRTELILLRKAVIPAKDMLSSLRRLQSPLMDASLDPFLADVHDHALQVAESTDTVKDLVDSLRDAYNNSISNRTNEIMRVLTIISTLFIPITFVVGLYGMNFKHMPELDWAWGYYACLGAIGAITAGQFWFFRKKGWL